MAVAPVCRRRMGPADSFADTVSIVSEPSSSGIGAATTTDRNKGAISPPLGDQVGVDIGLILGIATAAVQTAMFAMGLKSRNDDSDHTHSDR